MKQPKGRSEAASQSNKHILAALAVVHKQQQQQTISRYQDPTVYRLVRQHGIQSTSCCDKDDKFEASLRTKLNLAVCAHRLSPDTGLPPDVQWLSLDDECYALNRHPSLRMIYLQTERQFPDLQVRLYVMREMDKKGDNVDLIWVGLHLDGTLLDSLSQTWTCLGWHGTTLNTVRRLANDPQLPLKKGGRNRSVDKVQSDEVYVGDWGTALTYVEPQSLLSEGNTGEGCPPVICVLAVEADSFRKQKGLRGAKEYCRIVLTKNTTAKVILMRCDDATQTLTHKQRCMYGHQAQGGQQRTLPTVISALQGLLTDPVLSVPSRLLGEPPCTAQQHQRRKYQRLDGSPARVQPPSSPETELEDEGTMHGYAIESARGAFPADDEPMDDVEDSPIAATRTASLPTMGQPPSPTTPHSPTTLCASDDDVAMFQAEIIDSQPMIPAVQLAVQQNQSHKRSFEEVCNVIVCSLICTISLRLI